MMTYLTPDDIELPMDEIHFTYVRSAGPGGQNVNKVSSKAVMVWNPSESSFFAENPDALERLIAFYPSCFNKKGELFLTSQLTRDAPRNRQDCLEKLKNMLVHAFRKPKHRIRTTPTRGSNARRLDSKAKNSQKKANRRFNGNW